MVLGREMGICNNLGDSPNPSAILKDVITRSELELQRFALPPSHFIAVKRRVDRRISDKTRLEEEYIENLISDRARKIESLSRQLLKKRRETLNKEIVAFVNSGKSLRKVSSAEITSDCDNDERLCAS